MWLESMNPRTGEIDKLRIQRVSALHKFEGLLTSDIAKAGGARNLSYDKAGELDKFPKVTQDAYKAMKVIDGKLDKLKEGWPADQGSIRGRSKGKARLETKVDQTSKLQAIPEELEPLSQEARKYSTFEDFERALFSTEWGNKWRFKEGLLGNVAVLGFPKATELATGGRFVVSGRKGIRDFWESAVAFRNTAKLQAIHDSRSPRSKSADESQSNATTIEPDDPRVEAWLKDQGRSDIVGIDTPRKGKSKKSTRRSKTGAKTPTQVRGLRR